MAAESADHYGLGEPSILEKIDKLFACGVGELVDLPQIVVVGDQSSGKSSVLEGLIKKPLPRDSGLCTRFATQIVFRRATADRISISIIPDRESSADYCANVKAWGKDDLKTLDSSAFSEIMREVHEVMGLSTESDAPREKPTFSNDVLRLEICGPGQEHLSVIDVPGIFKNTTVGQTTKADISLVRGMVLAYMKNPRSVMLAVIPANVDVATQEILELAKEVDPEGDRTLGVLTKPDLVDKGTELRVIDLVEGRARRMKLGWHLVRNPGQMDLSDTSLNRGSLEMDFFRFCVPWSAVDKERVGIESLRDRLKEVLSGLVKREFPRVQQEIRKRLAGGEKQLGGMGSEREGPAAQMAFLTEIATKFQRLVSQALSANYGADDVFDTQSALRIAPAVTIRMSAFSDDMAQQGQAYSFLPQSPTSSNNIQSVPATAEEEAPVAAEEEPWTIRKPHISRKKYGYKPPKPFHIDDLVESPAEEPPPPPDNIDLSSSPSSFHIRKYQNSDDLVDILHPQQSLPRCKQGEIQKWLLEVYQTNRGFELGTFNSSILATAMKKQSSKWADISLGYVSDIIVMVHGFITTALDSICTDLDVRNALFDVLSEGLFAQYRNAIKHTHFLLAIESNGTPITMNHYFNDNLQKSRQGQVVATLKGVSISDCSHGEVVRLQDAMKSQSMSNTEHAIQDIHDILKSYYKVTRKTFVDNVCKQATNHFLLNGPDSPLKFFSPMFVTNLSTGELESIAGEAAGLKRARAQLRKEIATLTEAKKVLGRA